MFPNEPTPWFLLPVAGACALALLAGACRTDPAPSGARPNPRTVAPLLGPGATSADLPLDGGTLTARGPDGTVYTLVVPDSALLHPTRITMTPLAAVERLGMSGGLIAGVHLEPSGHVLNLPALLRVEVPEPLDGDRLTAFAYRGQGGEMHLYPVHPRDLEENRLTLRITHFSGYGVGNASPEERRSQLVDHPPTSVEDQLRQELAEALWEQLACGRSAAGCAGAGAASGRLERLRRTWWEHVLRPALLEATTDCSRLPDAMAKYLSWTRESALHDGGGAGGSAGRIPEAEEMLEEAKESCLRLAMSRCADSHDLDLMASLVPLRRQSALLGAGAGVAKVSRWLSRCFAFELEFQTQLGVEAGEGDVVLEYAATARTLLEPARLSGTAPLEVREVTAASGDDCTARPGPVRTHPLVVDSIGWRFAPQGDGATAPAAGGARIEGLELHLKMGAVQLQVTYTCPDDPPVVFTVDMSGQFTAGFHFLHEAESPSYNAYVIALGRQEVPAGALFARKTYDGSSVRDGSTYRERTVFTLWHRPQR